MGAVYYGGGGGSVFGAVFGLFAMGIILLCRLAAWCAVAVIVAVGVIIGMTWGVIKYYRERGDRKTVNDIMDWEPVTGVPLPVMSPVEDKGERK